MTFGMTANAMAAQTSDINGHWAQKTLETWIGKGLLNGYSNGNYNPEGNITRSEFMALVNRIMDYTKSSDTIKQYSDVSADQWYYTDVAKALAAGYITGTQSNLISPEQNITREQAITMLARIKEAKATQESTQSLNQVADASAISQWAKTYIAAALNEGLVSGDQGRINPQQAITRSEAIVLLDRVRTNSRIYNFAGTFGPAEGTLVAKDVTILSPSVNLRNMNVEGNLEIAASVGNGDAKLDNVLVNGKLLVNGGGKNSLYFANVTVEGGIVVRKDDKGAVRIVVSGDTEIKSVVLETGAILVTQELKSGGIKEVIIPPEYIGNSPVEFIGRFDSITNRAANTELVLSGASIDKMNLEAKTNVTGKGTNAIATANISKEAAATTMAIKPSNIEGQGAKDAKIQGVVNNGSVANTTGGGSNSSNTSGGSGNTSSDNGGSSSSTTVYNIVSIAPIEQEVEHHVAYALPETVTVTLSNGTQVQLNVVWSSSSVKTDTCGTFNYSGTVVATTAIANPNALKASLNLKVKPVLEQIGISKVPNKVLYVVGQPLDLTGLIVEAKYSDGSSKEQPVTLVEMSGYDSNVAGTQKLTVTVNGKTATFDVTVYEQVKGELKSFEQPKPITGVQNGAAKTVAGLGLPESVVANCVYESKNNTVLLNVNWNIAATAYDPTVKSEQNFDVKGLVQLPKLITQPEPALSLDTSVSVTVYAAQYSVSFDLSGHSAASIPSQKVAYNSKVVQPLYLEPNFEGWYNNAQCTGESYNFDTPVQADLVLYAKWTKTVLPTDALTFDSIKGANANEQSIISDLTLLTTLAQYPGLSISWSSTNPSVIAPTGKVNRPTADGNDVLVTLTATLSLNGSSDVKAFNVLVRKVGVDKVTTNYIDAYFDKGYPMATIEDGKVQLYIKLNKAAEVYITGDSINSNNWDSTVTGVLHGHATTPASKTSDNNAVYVNYCGYEKVTDSNSVIKVSTNIQPSSAHKIKLNMVIRDGNYTSTEVTTIVFDMETVIAADTTPPRFSNAYLNATNSKVYIFSDSEPLNLSTAPDVNAFKLAKADNASNGTVTAVSLHNSNQNVADSYIELDVTGITAPEDLNVIYTAQKDRLEDAIGNDCKAFTLKVERAKIKIDSVAISPSAGTIKITLMPSTNSIVSSLRDAGIFNVTNNGTALDVKYADTRYNIGHEDVYLKFTPNEAINNIAVTYTPNQDTKTWAFDAVEPITFTGTVQYMPKISTDQIAAVYNGAQHEITVTFDNSLSLSATSFADCAFKLNVNGVEYQLRGSDSHMDYKKLNILILELGKHIPTLTGNIQMSYESHDEPLQDISGADMPVFGPVTVQIQ
jgi:uncharacterized repeat protein (TIGR02543 family)